MSKKKTLDCCNLCLCACRLPCSLGKGHTGSCDCGDVDGHRVSSKFWRENPVVPVVSDEAWNKAKEHTAQARREVNGAALGYVLGAAIGTVIGDAAQKALQVKGAAPRVMFDESCRCVKRFQHGRWWRMSDATRQPRCCKEEGHEGMCDAGHGPFAPSGVERSKSSRRSRQTAEVKRDVVSMADTTPHGQQHRLRVPLSHILTLWWGYAEPGGVWVPREVSSIQVDGYRLLVSLDGVEGVGLFRRQVVAHECSNCGAVLSACLKLCPMWRERDRMRVVYDVSGPAPSVVSARLEAKANGWPVTSSPFIWARRDEGLRWNGEGDE